HADFAAKEFAYERAYAVWEYANTPYLMDTAEHETGLGTGTLPGTEGDTVTDLSKIPVPDARENYLRILGQCETAQAAFLYASEKKENQETVESLMEDTVYAELKEAFARKAESYARVARAAVLIEETTADLERQRAEWTAKYTQYKDAPGGFARTGDGAAELTDEEVRRRDIVLAHMAEYANNNGGVDAYINLLIYENTLRAEIYRYETNTVNPYSLTLLKDARPWEYASLLAQHNAIDSGIRGDMAYLIAHGMNYALIDSMSANYRAYLVWLDGYHQADSNADTKNPVKRRKWRRIRNDRERKYKMYELRYNSDRAQLQKYLSNILNARNGLIATETKLRDLDEVRYVGKLSDTDTTSRNIRDSVLTRNEYALTSEDIEHVYDATDTDFSVDSESVNITSMRRKVLRKDVDGYAVMAEKAQEAGTWYLYILNSDGSRTGEKYATDDSSFKLSSDENGNTLIGAGELGDGGKAYFIDYVYSAANVAQVIRDSYGVQRDSARDEYNRYCEESVANLRHDNTVVLRDRETLWYGLLEQAASVGKTAGEIKSRFYEGYEKAVNELISDGNGTSVDDRILQSLITQNSAFQEQVWQHQKMKFTERKDRWMEEVAFIRNRGDRDWINQLNKFTNMWKRWRYDTRQRISEGEDEWQQSARDLNAKMAAWRQTTSNASADESMRLTWEEMESVIDASVQSINRSLPAAMRIDFDTDTLLRDAMMRVPAGIGVLGNTMNSVDTTAGFAEMLNLGLSPALSARYKEEMEDFEQGMLVMQNLRMIDIIHEILGNFEYQLGEANQNNYDNVMTGLAYYYDAPFMRHETRQWSLEVVRSHSLAATKYKTIRFQDYADFVNTTVVLKSLKGLDGTMIDFSDPSSYRGINSDDLAIYVKLEQTHLNREIENVLGEGGTFSTHS
ncbi:MAG TPA: hypothetical protein PK200_06240, partial [Spirochaetota bacterium]|nr:hypothetical protein [Spirochaetota bacterium]